MTQIDSIENKKIAKKKPHNKQISRLACRVFVILLLLLAEHYRTRNLLTVWIGITAALANSRWQNLLSRICTIRQIRFVIGNSKWFWTLKNYEASAWNSRRTTWNKIMQRNDLRVFFQFNSLLSKMSNFSYPTLLLSRISKIYFPQNSLESWILAFPSLSPLVFQPRTSQYFLFITLKYARWRLVLIFCI